MYAKLCFFLVSPSLGHSHGHRLIDQWRDSENPGMSLAVYTTALLNHRPIANEVPVIILDGENSSLGIGVSSLPATHPEKGEVRRIARSQPYG
ncbi:hypothetical protein N0609_13035 [Pseudomonas aeruginosa]|uniref:hypothetical protein n=1 Tax=Pseudomonas putida TaxID=303 RepID=UPI0012AC176D|nr:MULTISPECIES: hypothetical protein [Pseudomonas]MCS7527234.1 hypothetical protein [Pseudomonas aeruginosa]MCS8510078.1 hypothetical protein [Pseudomonas aeruginosa]MCS8541414.1 hypothetical protein [Pseudomonas aeruginosa]MCT0600560.1 hypothetical protein [Pseudomonas aeruginosa]